MSLSYAQQYYAKKKAQQLGITVEEYLSRKQGPKTSFYKVKEPVKISFDSVKELDQLNVNDRMLACYKSGLELDGLFSFDGGVPVGVNVMVTGDPGIGKTTMTLYNLAHMQVANKDIKCLFICGEMSKIQMYKYKQRYPIFGALKTMFPSDFREYSVKETLEQLLDQGFDYVLIDSFAEVVNMIKDDEGVSIVEAEKMLVDMCSKNNEGLNSANKYTSFFIIQQVTKNGNFAGSNRVKHMVDAHMEMRKETDKNASMPLMTPYVMFTKNRNGVTNVKYYFNISNDSISFTIPYSEEESDELGEEQETTFELVSSK